MFPRPVTSPNINMIYQYSWPGIHTRMDWKQCIPHTCRRREISFQCLEEPKQNRKQARHESRVYPSEVPLTGTHFIPTGIGSAEKTSYFWQPSLTPVHLRTKWKHSFALLPTECNDWFLLFNDILRYPVEKVNIINKQSISNSYVWMPGIGFCYLHQVHYRQSFQVLWQNSGQFPSRSSFQRLACTTDENVNIVVVAEAVADMQ